MDRSRTRQGGRTTGCAWVLVDGSETDHVCDMLIGWRLLFVSAFPLLEVPNFKTPASADERDLALQTELLAQVFRQDKTPLLVRCAMLRARMELAQKDTA